MCCCMDGGEASGSRTDHPPPRDLPPIGFALFLFRVLSEREALPFSGSTLCTAHFVDGALALVCNGNLYGVCLQCTGLVVKITIDHPTSKESSGHLVIQGLFFVSTDTMISALEMEIETEHEARTTSSGRFFISVLLYTRDSVVVADLIRLITLLPRINACHPLQLTSGHLSLTAS